MPGCDDFHPKNNNIIFVLYSNYVMLWKKTFIDFLCIYSFTHLYQVHSKAIDWSFIYSPIHSFILYYLYLLFISSLPSKSKLFTSSPQSNLAVERGIPSHIALPVYAKTGIVPPSPQTVEIKNKTQIDAIRHACQTARKVVTLAGQLVNVGWVKIK